MLYVGTISFCCICCIHCILGILSF